jgi:primase-polymerase (primpol)-like protein
MRSTVANELQLMAPPRGENDQPTESETSSPPSGADGFQHVCNVPHQLKQLRQWVTYRLVFPHPFPDDGHIQLLPLKPKKHPFDAKTGAPAAELDPATWSTFHEASAALKAECYDGIGFVFSASDPFVGIDLDYAYDQHLAEELEPGSEPHLQAVKGWAAAIVRRHAPKGYVEISQSKRGLHVICRGRLPGAGGKRLVFDPAGEIVGQIEMYDRNKFFAVTGHELMGIHQPRLLRGDQTAISATYQAFGFNGLVPSNEAIRW